jgi:23S rRNA pseudouridine1911/1915/1917 synthase
MSPVEVTVPQAEAGVRLDAWLSERLTDLSRSRIQALIRSGDIRVDGALVRPGARVAAGARVSVHVPPPEPSGVVAQDIPLDVLYEDADVLVVNKPPGLVVHPAAGHARGTLVNALLYRCADLAGVGGEERPGIVHRLDKDTSGALVVAKHDKAMRGLVAGFKAGTVRKEYTALVEGLPRPPMRRIETLIGRHPHDRKKMSAQPRTGRPAASTYRVVEELGPVSLVQVVIETGRTHQIRVHMAHIGHPVVGDRQYGRRMRAAVGEIPVPRQMLHAARLAFDHPCAPGRVEVGAPIPEDMAAVLAALRAGDRPVPAC